MENNNNEVIESLLNSLINVDTNDLDENTLEILSDFKILSRSHQIALLNKILDNLNFYKYINQEELNKKQCEKEGHIYSSWYERICFKSYKGSTFKNKIWCRKCSRCGYFDYTFVKPIELVKLEEEHNLENEIKVLQKKLTNLRNGE